MGGERRTPARATGPRCRGGRPVLTYPNRSASPALYPCGHAASFRRRASSFVRGAWSSAAPCLAAVLCVCARCVRRAGAGRRAHAWRCPVAAAAAAVACALQAAWAVVARCVRGTSSRIASAACGVRGVRATQHRGRRHCDSAERGNAFITMFWMMWYEFA